MPDCCFTVVAGDEASAFETCGSDADGALFQDRLVAHRFEPLLHVDRRPSGVAHGGGPAGDRREAFDHFTLHLLCEGVLHGGAPGEERPLAPGDIILFDMARPPRMPADGAHILTLSLPRDVVEAAVPAARDFHGRILLAEEAALLGSLMRSLARRGSAVSAKAAAPIRRAVAELLAAALAADGPAETMPVERVAGLRLERAKAYIDAHLADSRLDAESVASGVGLSRSVLYRLFAPAGGVGQHILTRRLERMQAALRRPVEQRSISALAYDHGFSSESHCSRAFRAAYGVPPGRYRAAMWGRASAPEEQPCEATSRGVLPERVPDAL